MVEISSTNLLQQTLANSHKIYNSQVTNPVIRTIPNSTAADIVDSSGTKKPLNKNTLTKIAVGISAIAVTIATAISLKNKVTPQKLQKIFNEVYMRNDITIEEAQKIANRYKELEKIKDKEEFVKATFEEVKKNFGYGDKPIKLEITRNGDGIGGCIIDNSSIKIDIHEKSDNRKLLSLIHHEFRHAKQHELTFNQYPEFAKEKLLNVILKEPEVKKFVDTLIDQNVISEDEIYTKVSKKFEHLITEKIETNFGKLTPANVPEKYKDFAKKCMENQKNYIRMEENKKAYRKQFVEEDAYHVQKQILNLMENYKN